MSPREPLHRDILTMQPKPPSFIAAFERRGASAVTRPALWALGFLVAGVLAGTGVGVRPLAAPFLIGLLLLGVCVCGALYQRYRYAPVFLFALFLGMGMWRGTVRMAMPYIPLLGENQVFTGRVLDTGGRTAAGNQRAVVRAGHEGSSLRLMVYVHPALPALEIGNEVRLAGSLTPLSRAGHPGAYDAFMHLRPQKIDAIIWPSAIEIEGTSQSFFTYMRSTRDRLAAVFDEVLPLREAGIIRSMVLGDREDLDRDLVEIYRVAGIRHVLSISGMHVTILTLFINMLLGKLINPRKAGLLTLGIMLVYCLMTGAAIATVRAVTMGGVLVFARVLYREYDLLTSISWACAALLIYEPLMLYNVGFQLSFGAVYGIAVLTAPFERLLARAGVPPGGKIRNGVAVSMAATVSTYIVFAHHFYEIPLYSVITNALLLPFLLALLVLGVITALVGLVSLSAAALPAGGVFFILRMYEFVSRFFGGLPGALIPTGGGNAAVSLAAAGVLLLFAYVMHGFGGELKKRLPVLLFAVAALMFTVYIRDYPPRERVTALDTHGGYTVTRHRATTVVHGAARGGEAAVARYLDRRNIRRADALVLSEQPRPGDAMRLVPLMARTRALYLPAPERPLNAPLERAIEVNDVVLRWGTR